ncbi:MAG: hypothetical protein COB36_14005 [Alphaproteobacteria bacterium]|nr:MAG: hypothetical protein COB36_14005 [Alphaproteobacteria bacterium]
MTGQKKTPSGGNRAGANQIIYPKLTKPAPFPQERLLWQAHRECSQRVQNDPTPVNRAIAQIVAGQWKQAYSMGVQL